MACCWWAYILIERLVYTNVYYSEMNMKTNNIINYGNLPYTDFIRTETLCQGGKLCDFRFVRHDTDAGDGWERSNSI